MAFYYAHSWPSRDLNTDGTLRGWQLLAAHLRNVAAGAAHRAALVRLPGLIEAARMAGWLHDLGKYRPEFQDYLDGKYAKGNPLTYHKQAGAAAAWSAKNPPVAFAIAGHHGGLPDPTDLKAIRQSDGGQPLLTEAFLNKVKADCQQLPDPIPVPPEFSGGFRADLFTRLLFSCLVDADWADTGDHERTVKKLPSDPSPPPLIDPDLPKARLDAVLAYIAERAKTCPDGKVKTARADVLAACREAAAKPPGLFSLTVPTGGGKTLAGLAFALEHAAKHAAAHGLRRVIYVAPYMSILDQTVDVVRAALGLSAEAPDVFVHYSLAEPAGGAGRNDTARDAAARRAENWDAPVVLTTNVQFFESLFANQPGRCRKLHNIARSVILLDECQTLPPGLVAPTCGMLRQLVADLGCTVVLCTATQPAFDHGSLKADEKLTAEEIVPKKLREGGENDLFARLKRVTVSWPKAGEKLEWSAVADRMTENRDRPQALCVVESLHDSR